MHYHTLLCGQSGHIDLTYNLANKTITGRVRTPTTTNPDACLHAEDIIIIYYVHTVYDAANTQHIISRNRAAQHYYYTMIIIIIMHTISGGSSDLRPNDLARTRIHRIIQTPLATHIQINIPQRWLVVCVCVEIIWCGDGNG